MDSPLVMSVIGPDRPGLVELIAGAVRAADGNWLESRMCRLGGQFAGILRVSVPAERRETLLLEMARLEERGLSVLVRDGASLDEASCSVVAMVEIVGNDRPGIVSQISSALARRGANVEELNTECRSAPMSGGAIFEAKARVCLPPGSDEDELRQDLERIASDLMIDIAFERK